MRESNIEKKVTEYAKRKGWLSYKFVAPSTTGVPDRIYMHLGVAFFIEFKQKGKKPTAKQRYEIEKIRKRGVRVYIVDEISQGKRAIDDETVNARAKPLQRRDDKGAYGACKRQDGVGKNNNNTKGYGEYRGIPTHSLAIESCPDSLG